MQLKKFKVDKYKCIDHSEWIDVNELTVIVGKNEAGKTTLLKALHKLNPFKSEPYIMEREWPRGKRRERDIKQIVCTAVFELSDIDITELSTLSGKTPQMNLISITRNYADEFAIGIKELFKEDLTPELNKTVSDFIKEILKTFIYIFDYKIFYVEALLDLLWNSK
jgi:AAA15 family ATPase/GTPase